MIVLILLFIVQFSVACACLALNLYQQQLLFVMGWHRASASMKYSMQAKYDCCGVTEEYQNETLYSNTDLGYGHPPCANSTLVCLLTFVYHSCGLDISSVEFLIVC